MIIISIHYAIYWRYSRYHFFCYSKPKCRERCAIVSGRRAAHTPKGGALPFVVSAGSAIVIGFELSFHRFIWFDINIFGPTGQQVDAIIISLLASASSNGTRRFAFVNTGRNWYHYQADTDRAASTRADYIHWDMPCHACRASSPPRFVFQFPFVTSPVTPLASHFWRVETNDAFIVDELAQKKTRSVLLTTTIFL